MSRNSVWLWLILVLCVFDVQGQNPFDIKGRKAKSYTTPQKIVPATELKQDSAILKSDPIEVVPAPILPKKPATSNIASVVGNDNPFNVSHVPLRKTTVESRSLSKAEIKQEKESFISRNIPLGIILISLLLIALVINFRDDAIKNSIRSSYNANFLKLIKAESVFGLSRSYVLLYIFFALNAALALNQILYRGINQISKFGLILLAVVGIYLAKHFWLISLGKIFKNLEKQVSDYSFAVQIGNIVLGMVLLPLNIIMIYGISRTTAIMVTIVLGVFCLAYLFRLSRGVLMSSNLMLNGRFHFFLYLCACEIGPFLILMKFLKGVI